MGRSPKITRDLGGNALNAVGTSRLGDKVVWAKSGMSRTWFQNYEEQKYYLATYLEDLLNGQTSLRTNSGMLKRDSCSLEKSYELNHVLLSHGYGSFVANSFGDPQKGGRTLILHSSERSLASAEKEIGFDRLRVVQD